MGTELNRALALCDINIARLEGKTADGVIETFVKHVVNVVKIIISAKVVSKYPLVN